MSQPQRGKTTLGFFSFLILAGSFSIPVFSSAELIMDSADSLSVSKASAFERVKNGYFQDGLNAGEGALKTAEDRYGKTHSAIVPYLMDLATIDRYLALYSQAESNLKWALALQERNLGAGNNALAEPLEQLAALYLEEGRFEEARFYGEKAYALIQKKYSAASQNQASYMTLLAAIFVNLYRLDEAKDRLTQSLQLQEGNPKSDPSQVLQTLKDIAKICLLDHHPEESLTALRKSLEKAKASFPADSIQVADALEQLADGYRSQKKADKAGPLYASALPIYQRFVGVYFGYSTLDYVLKLAKAYEAAGKYAEADDLLGKSLQTLKETFGTNHPRLALGLMDKAEAEKALGKAKEAREHLRTALVILKTYFPDQHPLVKKAQKQLDQL